MGVGPLPGDQTAVPAHQGLWSDHRFDLAQRLAPQRMSFACESTPFGIRESNAPLSEAFLQKPILFLQVLDHVELPTIDPAGEHCQNKLQRLHGLKHHAEYSDLPRRRGR